MTPLLDRFLQRLAGEPAVLVRVTRTEGSVPREAGTWMAVWPQGQVGTIGGGRLEHEALMHARGKLGHAADPAGDPAAAPSGDSAFAGDLDSPRRFPLGPSLGQCCGGVVWLAFERVGPADAPSLAASLGQAFAPVAVFGGGHVGAALVRLLASLPFSVRWIDSRDGQFPDDVPLQVATEHSEPVEQAVAGLPTGCRVLIMSFSHAEDFDILMACLRRRRSRDDLPYVGLIGSRTKWATFRHRLEARGFGEHELARVTCPIGLPGIEGKEPEVIAVGVAAQLLQLAGHR